MFLGGLPEDIFVESRPYRHAEVSVDCTGVSGSHMERFLKNSLPGWIFMDFEVILEGVLGAMLLIISVSTRCSVGVMGTAREPPDHSPDLSRIRGQSLSK